MKIRKNWNTNFPLVLIGVAFLIFGTYFGIDAYNFMKNAEKTTATVTNVRVEYRMKHTKSESIHRYVTVSYNVEDKEYFDEYSAGILVPREGDNVTIYYDIEQPNNIKPSGFFIPFILLLFGGMVAIYGYISSNKCENSVNDKYKDIRKLGKIIYANIDKVEENKLYVINGKRPYVIKCSYFDETANELYEFESQNIMYDIKTLIESNNITIIPVKLGRNKYCVDVKSLDKYKSKDCIEVYNKNE